MASRWPSLDPTSLYVTSELLQKIRNCENEPSVSFASVFSQFYTCCVDILQKDINFWSWSFMQHVELYDFIFYYLFIYACVKYQQKLVTGHFLVSVTVRSSEPWSGTSVKRELLSSIIIFNDMLAAMDRVKEKSENTGATTTHVTNINITHIRLVKVEFNNLTKYFQWLTTTFLMLIQRFPTIEQFWAKTYF